LRASQLDLAERAKVFFIKEIFRKVKNTIPHTHTRQWI